MGNSTAPDNRLTFVFTFDTVLGTCGIPWSFMTGTVPIHLIPL